MNTETWILRAIDFDSKSDIALIEALIGAKLYGVRDGSPLYGVFTPDDSLVAVMGGASPSTLVGNIGSAIIEDYTTLTVS